MSADWPWSELGLASRSDARAIRSAYAARLKQIDREDPVAFQALRSAFDAAKTRASGPSAPPRPRMGDLVSPIAEPLPAPRPPAPAPLAQPALTASERPEPLAQDLPISALDEAAEADPQGARALFFARLSEAVRAPGAWDHAALDALLSLDMAQEPALRRAAEDRVFGAAQSLGKVRGLASGRLVMGKATARLLDEHFAWYSDGVGFSRRFRHHSGFMDLIDALHANLGAPEVPPFWRKWPVRKHYLFAWLGVWFVGGMLWGDRADQRSWLAMGVISAGIFGISWALVGFVIHAIHTAAVFRLFHPLMWVWNRARRRWRLFQRVDGAVIMWMRPRSLQIGWIYTAMVLGQAFIIYVALL